MAEESVSEEKILAIPPGRRAAILDNALRCLPAGATAKERQRAIEAGRTAIRDNVGVSEPQLVEAVKLAVACVAEDVCQRQADEQVRQRRETRKHDRVETCVNHIRTYLHQRYADREIDYDAVTDFDWIRDLERKARRRAEAELSGKEEPKESDDDAKAIAEKVVDEELDEGEE